MTVPKMAGDDEYGEQVILARKSNWEPWAFGTRFGASYTDNVALSSAARFDDWYFEGALYGKYTPKIKGNLFGDISIQQSFYRYDEFSVLDFDLFETDIGLLYAAQNFYDIMFFANYGYYRIMESGFGDSIFQNHSGVVGAQKIFRISRGHQAYAGLGADLSMDGSPDIARRHEYFWNLGYTIKWTDRITTGIGYRGAYYDYTDFDRHDWNNSFAISGAVEITDWASITTTVNFTTNDSNIDLFDYDNWIVGAYVGLEARF